MTGTHVIEGSGKVVIVAVGLNSQTGKIYRLLGAVKDKPKRKKDKSSLTSKVDADPHPEPDSESASLDIPLNDLTLEKKSADTERKLKNHSVFQNKLNMLTYKIGLLGFVCASGTAAIIIVRFCIHNYGVLQNSWSSDDLTTMLDSVIVGITILGIRLITSPKIRITLSTGV